MPSLGLGLGLGRAYKTQYEQMNVLIIGDSIAGHILTHAYTPFKNALENFFQNVSLNSVTIAGIASVKSVAETIPPSGIDYIYNDQTQMFSSEFLTQENVNGIIPNDYKAGILVVGSNDVHSSLETGFDDHLYETYYTALISAILERYPNMKRLLCVPIHRNYSSVFGHKQFQGIRSMQEKICDSHQKLVLTPPIYDTDLNDTVHPTSLAFQNKIASRLACSLAAAMGKRSFLGTNGPVIDSAIWDGFSVVAHLQHDHSHDFTLPNGGEDFFRVTTNLGIYMPYIMHKINSSELQLDMDNSSIQVSESFLLNSAYGQMASLSQVNPEIIKDNSVLALPLRASNIAIDNQDVISKLSDLVLHGRTKIVHKIQTDTTVHSFQDLMGKDYTILPGRQPDYDPLAFDGAGALVAPDNTTSFVSHSFAASPALMVGLVIEFPVSFGGNRFIASLGNVNGGRFDAGLLVNAAGALVYSDDNINGDQTIAFDCRAQRAIILLNYIDSNNLDIYYNSTTAININPDDVYSSRSNLWFMALNNTSISETGTKIGEWFVKTSAHHHENDPSIAEIISYYNQKYAIGL